MADEQQVTSAKHSPGAPGGNFGPSAMKELPLPAPIVAQKTVPARESLGRVVLGGAVVVALSTAAVAFWKSFWLRQTGIGGFAAVAASTGALLVLFLHLWEIRREPLKFSRAWTAAALAALAMILGGLYGQVLRAEAAPLLASDVAYEPGMKEYLVHVAHASGRAAGLAGLLGLPLAILAIFALLAAVGRRRLAKAPSPDVALKGPELEALAETPDIDRKTGMAMLWTAIVTSILMSLGGAGLSFYSIFQEVPEGAHPHEKTLTEIREGMQKEQTRQACSALEKALSPDYLPAALLARELPDREALAERCMTVLVDDLVREGRCSADAKTLAGSHVSKLIDGEARVEAACAK